MVTYFSLMSSQKLNAHDNPLGGCLFKMQIRLLLRKFKEGPWKMSF